MSMKFCCFLLGIGDGRDFMALAERSQLGEDPWGRARTLLWGKCVSISPWVGLPQHISGIPGAYPRFSPVVPRLVCVLVGTCS